MMRENSGLTRQGGGGLARWMQHEGTSFVLYPLKAGYR
jgi:hypothetical protein